MINARAESVATKPSFRAAFKRRRCLVPADGYYEWRKTGAGKQPYHIHLPDDTPFAMAGLWESWRGGGDDDVLESFTVITTDANAATHQIHDRMPVILDRDSYPMWLDPEFADADALQSLLEPYGGDDLQLDPVSTLVNNPRHEGPQCLEPATVE
jgi:putative SOS response-associated peptidase YedK